GKVSDYIRIIRLPAAVVTLAHKRTGERIQNSGFFGTGSLIEIARILFQQRRHNGAAEESTYHDVTVRCAVALRVALRSLPVSTESVSCLLKPSQNPDPDESERIDRRPRGQFELLFRREGNRIRDVADIKIRNDAKYALLLLFLYLHFCQFD